MNVPFLSTISFGIVTWFAFCYGAAQLHENFDSFASSSSANYLQMYNQFFPICNISNKILNRYNVSVPEVRPWTFTSRSYVNYDKAGGSPFKMCHNISQLLESSKFGSRIPQNTDKSVLNDSDPRDPFHPSGCAYHWFNVPEQCNILSRFARVEVIGDSISRHLYQIMVMLATPDYAHGALNKNSSNPQVYTSCACDGQLSESLVCRHWGSHAKFNIPSSHGYGLCLGTLPFSMEYLVDSSSSEKRYCMNDTRPRISIIQFGVHLGFEPSKGVSALQNTLYEIQTSGAECSTPFAHYFIVFSCEPSMLFVQMKYPRQSEARRVAYNKAISDYIDTLPRHYNVLYLDSSEIIRGGAYSDGLHPLSESVSIRAMYLLNIMRIFAATTSAAAFNNHLFRSNQTQTQTQTQTN